MGHGCLSPSPPPLHSRPIRCPTTARYSMPFDRNRLDRRSFLGVSAGAGLLCTLDGVPLSGAGKQEIAASDASARSLRKPVSAKAADNEFPTPEPQPGGKVREYWIQTRSRM